MEPLNRTALELVDEVIDFADELNVAVHHLENDAAVIDFGVGADGGIEAGLSFAEIATGGLATVGSRTGEVAGAPVPHVELATDHPLLALLGSGKAGWEFDGFDGVGSGPARLLADGAGEFDGVAHEESFDFAVLAVESATLPDESVAESVASRAGVPTGGFFLPVAPAASLVGSVAVAARAAEVAVLRLSRLGYDPRDVLSASSSAPVAPVAGDERTAVGRTNDAIAYGGRVHLVVREDADVSDLPFESTDAYGRPFEAVLAEAGWEFEAAADAFAPAKVTVDVRGGPTHVVGSIDGERLAESFGLCG